MNHKTRSIVAAGLFYAFLLNPEVCFSWHLPFFLRRYFLLLPFSER